MKEEKYKCPLCHISHNDTNNKYFNINNSKDENILCSQCLNKLLKEENNLIFPKDLISNKITELEEETEFDNFNTNTEVNEVKHELNQSIMDEIKRDSMNKTLIQEFKQQMINKHLISNIKSDQLSSKDINKNNLNLSYNSESTKNIHSMKNYYIKKTVKVNKNPEYQRNTISYPNCNIHSLPLSMICLNENRKICPKCIFDKKHLGHEIITEKEYLVYINELNIIYNTIEKNENNYNNFNQKFFGIIEDINDKFMQIESQIVEIKNEIIKNINTHFTSLSNFINLRRKEIFDKFQYCNYDISDLINSSVTWMKTVKDNCAQEIDIKNLINSGKELNNRFNFVKEINEIFNILKEYKESGLSLIKNNFNEMPVIIKENKEIIKLLNLTPYEDISKENNNKFKSNETSDINNNSSTNLESTKIYCKKIITDDHIRYNNTVSDFYQNKNKRKMKQIKQEQNNIQKNNSINYNRISVTKIKNKKNNNSESNESNLPFLDSINTIKRVRYSNSTKNKLTKNSIIKYKNKESIQVNDESDNNININFNGHIFNYNSDSNISIILSEKNKNKIIEKKKEGKKDNKNKRKLSQKIFTRKDSDSQNFNRCFSLNENCEKENNYSKINKKIWSPFTAKNMKIICNIKKHFLQSTNNKNKKTYNEKSFLNFTTNKNNKKIKSSYKTMNNKELEKYISFQLKKIKPSFYRINLRDYGIQLICSFFKKNKNKTFKELKLQSCNLNDNNLELLINCIKENNITIPIINISDNELTDNISESIINFLNENEQITNLIISNNSFSKQTKEKIKEFVNNRKEQIVEFNKQI